MSVFLPVTQRTLLFLKFITTDKTRDKGSRLEVNCCYTRCCSWRRGGERGDGVFQTSRLRLQKTDPMDLESVSHKTSPTVNVPLKSKVPLRRADSVPSQYRTSCPVRSTTYSSLPKLWLGARSAVVMESCTSTGTSDMVFTQHSKVFFGFLTRMCTGCLLFVTILWSWIPNRRLGYPLHSKSRSEVVGLLLSSLDYTPVSRYSL